MRSFQRINNIWMKEILFFLFIYAPGFHDKHLIYNVSN